MPQDRHSEKKSSVPYGRALRLLACVTLGILCLVHSRVPSGLLQGFAWTRMYTEYRETFNTLDSLRLTFSGEQLCGLCETVQTLQKVTDQFPILNAGLDKVLLFPVVLDRFSFKYEPPSKRWTWVNIQVNPEDRKIRPPLPPPRGDLEA